MTATDAPPGIPSPARLAGWLNDHVPGGPVELTDIQLIAGGRSNLTYRLTVSVPNGTEGSRLLVLRRPPLGHVLPTAHDMSREYRVLSALAGTQVPVAPLVAACTDDAVIGAPFYVMEHVPGIVIRTRADTNGLTEPQAADLSRRRVPAAPARPLAAAVEALRDQGDARLRRARGKTDRRAPRRGRSHTGPRGLPAGQRAGHASNKTADHGRRGLGDGHPG